MIIINGQEDIENFDISSIQNVEELKIINIPKIPEGKFHGLNKLTKVYMSNINIIESGAFMDCKNLKDISFKNNPKEIYDFAFHNTNVSFIPELYQDTKFGVYNNLGKNIKLENLSWSDINKLSKLRKCKKYFKVGDEKQVQIGSDFYPVQIIGFDHDYKSDGRGKTAITFNFKTCIGNYYLNHEKNNRNGWEKSNMRSFLNNEIYNNLLFDLQSIIKTVDKISDNGNVSNSALVTTEDKIFLPSFEEIGFTYNHNFHYKMGQGNQYDFFSDYDSRSKQYNLDNSDAIWWLRSTYTNSDKFFFCVDKQGCYNFASANKLYGISPCFCI